MGFSTVPRSIGRALRGGPAVSARGGLSCRSDASISRDASQWRAITGERTPTKPPTAARYTKAGLPWFDYYSELEPVDATDTLQGVSSVAAIGAHKGETPLPENETVAVGNVIPLDARRPSRRSRQVREMS